VITKHSPCNEQILFLSFRTSVARRNLYACLNAIKPGRSPALPLPVPVVWPVVKPRFRTPSAGLPPARMRFSKRRIKNDYLLCRSRWQQCQRWPVMGQSQVNGSLVLPCAGVLCGTATFLSAHVPVVCAVPPRLPFLSGLRYIYRWFFRCNVLSQHFT
jgi:hypothetical protein